MTRSGASAAQPGPLRRAERRRLDRQPVDRRHEEAGPGGRAGKVPAGKGEGDQGDAGVGHDAQRRGGSRDDAAAAAGPPAHRDGEDDGRHVVRGLVGAPTRPSAATPTRRARGRAPSSASGRWRRWPRPPPAPGGEPTARARRTPAAGSGPGRAAGPPPRRAATSRRPTRAKSSGSAASNEIWSAWPAYTPPSSGSTSRSTTSRPSRDATYVPSATSLVSAVAGSRWSSGTRSRAGQRQHLRRGQRLQVAGDPHDRPARERTQGAARPDVGTGRRMHHLGPEPAALREVECLRPARDGRLGADVDGRPRHGARGQLAADALRRLEHGHPDARADRVAPRPPDRRCRPRPPRRARQARGALGSGSPCPCSPIGAKRSRSGVSTCGDGTARLRHHVPAAVGTDAVPWGRDAADATQSTHPRCAAGQRPRRHRCLLRQRVRWLRRRRDRWRNGRWRHVRGRVGCPRCFSVGTRLGQDRGRGVRRGPRDDDQPGAGAALDHPHRLHDGADQGRRRAGGQGRSGDPRAGRPRRQRGGLHGPGPPGEHQGGPAAARPRRPLRPADHGADRARRRGPEDRAGQRRHRAGGGRRVTHRDAAQEPPAGTCAAHQGRAR